MNTTTADILKTFDSYWLNRAVVTNEIVGSFRSYCAMHEKRFTTEQKAIAALTESMLLRSGSMHNQAGELITANRKRFNRISEPIYVHRWQRMQLIDQLRTGRTAEIYTAVQRLAQEAETEGWYHEQMRALVLVHLVEVYMGLFKKAVETALRRKQLAIEHNDIDNQREALVNIAHTYQRYKHKQQALEELEKAKPLFNGRITDTMHLHYNHLLAVCYHENNFADKALALNKSILAEMKQNGIEDTAVYISVASNIAVTYLEKGKYGEAEKQFLEIQDFAGKNNWLLYRLDIALHLCDVYHPWKKYDKMHGSLKAAEKLLKEVNLPEFEVRVLNRRAQYEKAVGNTATALSCFEKYHRRYAEWKDIDDAEKIKAMELKSELLLEQHKQEMMKKENQLQQQELQMLNSFLGQKDKLIQEFATHYKELQQTTLKRRAIFERLNEMVRSVEFTAQEERNTYSAKFNDAHQKSVVTLQKSYPKLSNSEAKIAVMLSQGLSNKEIAALTLTTLRNVETARLRMRKKMELTRQQDLLQEIRKVLL